MRVLLVSANTLTAPYPVYPLGLDHVAAAAAGRHQVRISDMNALGSIPALARTIGDFAPEIIGLSMRNIDNTDSRHPVGFMNGYLDLVKAIRHASSAPLVLGGSGFTIFPRAAMAVLGAEFGIIGEGERLVHLLDALENGADPHAIPGVISPGMDPTVPAPWPDRVCCDFDGDRPHLKFYIERGGMLNLQTKRGCPFRCVYCTYPHIEGRRLRPFDPEEVARTAVRLQQDGARYFFITDSVFNTDPAHCTAIARAFGKAGLTIPWGAFFAPVRPEPDFFKILAGAGLAHVEFGTESLSDPVLAAYQKPFGTQEVFSAHRAAVAAGLHVAHYFLLGGPGETPATVTETLSRIDNLRKSVLFLFCGMRIYPNTALHQLAVGQGQIRADAPLLDPVFYRAPDVGEDEIISRVNLRANGRINWVIGAGGPETEAIVERLHARGYAGPLWEHLIR
ncbi:MAG: radical SAM protein [Desulfobacterales bacterium]|nr:radical SAM protein [Desulfobacterales bacterium]